MGDWNPKANELFLEALEQPLGPAQCVHRRRVSW